MKWYIGPVSLFSAKVRIALEATGLTCDHVSVGFTREDRYLPHHPDVEGLNPHGQVPVLVDGDTVVCDSTVILEYLEDTHPEPALFPNDPTGRARCRTLEAFGDEVLFPPLWDCIEEVFYPPGDSGRDAERARLARQQLESHYGALDRELEGREFLCGDFSVADISCYVMASSASTLGVPPAEGQRHLLAWAARMAAHPTVRREVEGMQACVAEFMRPG